MAKKKEEKVVNQRVFRKAVLFNFLTEKIIELLEIPSKHDQKAWDEITYFIKAVSDKYEGSGLKHGEDDKEITIERHD